VSVKLPDHGCIAWIDRIRLDVVVYKIEKAGQLRIANAFRVRAVARGESIQEGNGFEYLGSFPRQEHDSLTGNTISTIEAATILKPVALKSIDG
jgi:hypothetical protein